MKSPLTGLSLIFHLFHEIALKLIGQELMVMARDVQTPDAHLPPALIGTKV